MRASVDKIPVRTSTRELIGALLLVAVGGYGDAASFLLVGCFTGHTTGNSVLAAIAIATGGRVWEPIFAVVTFLCATAAAQRLSTSPEQPFGSRGFHYVLGAEIPLVFVSPFLLMAHHRFAFIACMSTCSWLAERSRLSRARGHQSAHDVPDRDGDSSTRPACEAGLRACIDE